MNIVSISTLTTIAAQMPANVSILIRGDHGIGKSQAVAQIADSLGLELIDVRLSQLSEGDIIGLPSLSDGSTRFHPPWWVKKACETACVLFLDELNRAQRGEIQAVFQIALDRGVQDMTLHPETRVFSAINTGPTYDVEELDPALLDRFWVCDLSPTTEEWLRWARGVEMNSTVVGFISENHGALEPSSSTSPGDITPSRRSWARLASIMDHIGYVAGQEDPRLYPIACGLVGASLAIQLVDWAKKQKKVTAVMVLEGHPAEGLELTDINRIVDELVHMLPKTEFSQSMWDNFSKFSRKISPEIFTGMHAKLSAVELAATAKEKYLAVASDIFKEMMRAPEGNVRGNS